MTNYTYASNKAVNKAKAYAENVIQELRNRLKSKYELTFSHSIIGSTNLKLVTINSSTKEFDLDYDLTFEITKKKNASINKLKIKSQIVTELNHLASNTEKSSEGKITIKAKTFDENGKNKHLIDFAIYIKENDNIQLIKGFNGVYDFVQRANYSKQTKKYISLSNSNKERFRKIYLAKKNISNKESYQLFLDTLNEI